MSIGTGKTYVGVLISKLLLANRDLRSKKPLLFLCQTNHALDQMLEHVYKFEHDIVRLGARSNSDVMKSLSLQSRKSAMSAARGKPQRSDLEYEALEHISNSMFALKAAFAQRGIVIDPTNPTACFPNSTLARLIYILDELSHDGGRPVYEVLKGTSTDVFSKVGKVCQKVALDRAKAYRLDPSSWMQSDKEWDGFDLEKKLLYMALYAPNPSEQSLSDAPSIVDEWQSRAPTRLKAPKTNIDSDGFITVGEKPAYESSSDDEESLADEGADQAADLYEPIDGSLQTAWAVPDFSYEDDEEDRLRRSLDDDDWHENEDYGYSFSLTEGRGRQNRLSKDKSYVESNIRRNLDNSLAIKRLYRTLGLTRSDVKRLLNVRNVWALKPAERAELAKLWADILNVDAASDVTRYTNDYLHAAEVEAKYEARVDSWVLSSAAVIGMTTTGAAKRSVLLRDLQPQVVIVEEAAEVLEASIVSCLTQSTQQLILIGDHLQLRPQVTEHNLAVVNGLQVSLFERLIKQGMPYVTLSTQRRMHPEISSLITPSIYKSLVNAPSVATHPPVRGIPNRLWFISHTVPEDGQQTAFGADPNTALPAPVHSISLAINDGTKTNTFEAEYLVRLGNYLLQNGYDAKQIVILTMYKGQQTLIKKLAKDFTTNHPK